MAGVPRANTLTPDGYNHHTSSCGCHYKTLATLVGCIVGIPICILAYQDALLLAQLPSWAGDSSPGHTLFLIIKILVEVGVVVAFFVGIFTVNSRAVEPFIGFMVLETLFLSAGAIMAFLANHYYQTTPKIGLAQPFSLFYITLNEGEDQQKQLMLHGMGRLIVVPLMFYFIYVVYRCRRYLREWEDYDRLHPSPSVRERSSAAY